MRLPLSDHLGIGAVSSPLPAEAATTARIVECRFCGQFQMLPALVPGQSAQCIRCTSVIRRARTDTLGRALALYLACVSMFGLACLLSLMTVSTAGLVLSANLFSGPEGLGRNGLWELSIVVLVTTVAAPFAKIVCMTYVLLGLRLRKPPRHIRTVFGWVERINPWSMIEVYLLGVAVAYVKLQGLVHIEVGDALYALIFLMLTTVAADAVLDHQAVWEEMERRGVPGTTIDHGAMARTGPHQTALGCEVCGLVNVTNDGEVSHCQRCGSHLEQRKPNSINRTWALVIASFVLYIPANLYPVLQVIQLGSGQPSTILGGVEELIDSNMYPLAALVFFASILVPMLKLIGLIFLLLTTQLGWTQRLRDRTKIYRIVNAIGRWSMIDIFMESILVALVQFGSIVSIEPGVGAVAFCGVVIITMFAAEGFDSRLIWDAAAPQLQKAAA
jgi:paraquat-inducible protein A